MGQLCWFQGRPHKCKINVGHHHSIKIQVQERVSSCCFMGCPCHLIHNIASHASEALHKESGVDVEDICVDVFYWFDKARKGKEF